MIDRAIATIVGRLNMHLHARFGVEDDLAVATALIGMDGKPVEAARNQLAVFVTNISHEATFSRHGSPAIDGGRGTTAPPTNLELFLMLASNFDARNYLDSLKVLSGAMQLFQLTPVFDRANTPELDRGIEKLSFEIQNLDVEQLTQLWGAHGGRYVPSVLYRVRTIAIDAGALTEAPSAIGGPETVARPQTAGPGR